jgi:hypothetical protein
LKMEIYFDLFRVLVTPNKTITIRCYRGKT